MRPSSRVLSFARSRAARGAATRVGWGLADQTISSITNFAVGIYVARSLGLTEFGVFSLAWVTYGVMLNVSRGLATDPLVVRFSGVPTEQWRGAAERASGTALRAGLAAGALCVAAGLVIGGAVGSGFVGLGLVLPALLLQDSWRFAFFAAGQGNRAFANDMVWAVALVPAMLIATQQGTVFAFLLAWGAAGAVAAAYGCVQTGLRPRGHGVGQWLRDHRDLGTRYMVENVSYSGAVQLRMFGLGAIAGLADAGAVRGVELLMAPFIAMMMGLSIVAVPEAARMLRRSPRRLLHFCIGMGLVQSLGALLWGSAVLVLVSDAFGHFALGDVWDSASRLLVPEILLVMGSGISTGAAAGVRALGAARRSLRAQLWNSLAYLSCGLAGAAIAGALGTTWGVASAMTISIAVWWTQLRAGLREHVPATHEPARTGIGIDSEESR